MVSPKDIKCPIIKMAYVAIIEENLGVHGRIETHGEKWSMDLCQPSLSIYPDGELWSTQSLGML